MLIKLDGTTVRANLSIVQNTLAQLYARRARLLAEQIGGDGFTIPENLTELTSGTAAAVLEESERKLFASRKSCACRHEEPACIAQGPARRRDQGPDGAARRHRGCAEADRRRTDGSREALYARPCLDAAGDDAETRPGGTRGRPWRKDRFACAGGRKVERDRPADPPARRGPPHRDRQGTHRRRGQDRRIRRPPRSRPSTS